MTRLAPEDILVEGVESGVCPGGQLEVSREGERVISCASGVIAPGMRATHEEVVYDLASLTKPLATTVLIGREVDSCRLDLDAPLNRALPKVDPAITFAHALEHATGLPAHERFDRRLPPSIAPGTWAAFDHIVDLAVHAPRERPPGTRAVYSDLGFILLGAALERILATPISAAFSALDTALSFRDRRGVPAPSPGPTTAPIAPTEDCEPGEVHDENARAMGGAAGHAGLFGTARGVLAVAEGLVRAYHGERGGLLSPEMVRRLWRPSSVPGSTRTLGWDRPSAEGSSTGGRWPLHSVGHLGFTGTSVWVEPERALVAVLVTNRVCPTRANEGIRTLRPRIHDAIWSVAAGSRLKAPRP